MKIGILGSGQVAQTVGAKLADLEQEVMISSRDIEAGKDRGDWGKVPSAKAWRDGLRTGGRRAEAGSFEAAAKFGDVLINCTAGSASLQVLKSAGEKNLQEKILVDIANPLDFSKGMPPTLLFCNTDSLGERIQAAFPKLKVVKTLNTVTAGLMVNPGMLKNETDMLMAGNDDSAKAWTRDTLLGKWFGWKSVLDLGGISAARSMEMYLPLWLGLWGALQTPNFNFKIVK